MSVVVTPGIAVLLVAAGAVAGAINTVAGGGSLVSFPALVFGAGMASVPANATNAVCLWPGSLGGALGFRAQWPQARGALRLLFLPTLFGAVAGAFLLRLTPPRIFDDLVPGLIGLAAAMLLFQPRIKAWARANDRRVPPVAAAFVQFLVAVYGGYFGAGMGIMMLAAFALYVEGDLHVLNAVKTWLGVVINLSASVVFFLQGLVDLPVAAWLTLGSVAGGYAAAGASQRVDVEKLRRAVVAFALSMAAFYMVREWFLR